jgi:hypothetical protein
MLGTGAKKTVKFILLGGLELGIAKVKASWIKLTRPFIPRLPCDLPPHLSMVYRLYINQADIEECSQQVDLMRDIYARATEVIVWLEYTEKDKLAMDLFAMIEITLDKDGLESHELARRLVEIVSGLSGRYSRVWWK